LVTTPVQLSRASQGGGPPQFTGEIPANADAEFWQFGLSFPASGNPLLDETGALCQLGQRGGVWYLYGTFGGGPAERTCTLPSDKLLFFPVYNWVNVAVPGDTAKTLRAQLDPLVEGADLLEVTLDGKPAGPVRRLTSGVFSVTLPEDNLFGIPAGIYGPAVADGFWVMLPPLAAGSHELRFRAHAVVGPPAFDPGTVIEQETTYHLNVEDPAPIE
jgi:hypothetical protein